ncbi:hypothetical protein SDC9_137482 [bioreactor metagenome]|uniref:Uncharacterized protein n=1 Tax=bioreactor metagenome TaxID=1076179 RepID=A0A645DM82_9ZZZZ
MTEYNPSTSWAVVRTAIKVSGKMATEVGCLALCVNTTDPVSAIAISPHTTPQSIAAALCFTSLLLLSPNGHFSMAAPASANISSKLSFSSSGWSQRIAFFIPRSLMICLIFCASSVRFLTLNALPPPSLFHSSMNRSRSSRRSSTVVPRLVNKPSIGSSTRLARSLGEVFILLRMLPKKACLSPVNTPWPILMLLSILINFRPHFVEELIRQGRHIAIFQPL